MASDARAKNRVELMTGSAAARRINVNADFGATWQVTPTIALNDIFDFWYFRQPATNLFTNTNYAGTSMLLPPGAATTTTTPDYQALNQKTKINTVCVTWDAAPRARLSLGYRYSSRIITDAGGDLSLSTSTGPSSASSSGPRLSCALTSMSKPCMPTIPLPASARASCSITVCGRSTIRIPG